MFNDFFRKLFNEQDRFADRKCKLNTNIFAEVSTPNYYIGHNNTSNGPQSRNLSRVQCPIPLENTADNDPNNDYCSLAGTQPIHISGIDLNPENIQGIQSFKAGAGEAMMSKFGHSALRVVYCPNYNEKIKAAKTLEEKKAIDIECVNTNFGNYILSYRANTMALQINNFRGLGLSFSPSYPTQMFIDEISDYEAEYNLEDRNIYSSVFTFAGKAKGLSELERQELEVKGKDNFIFASLERYWTYIGEYNFLLRNCADELLEHIKLALADKKYFNIDAITPSGAEEELEDAGVLDRSVVAETEDRIDETAKTWADFEKMMNEAYDNPYVRVSLKYKTLEALRNVYSHITGEQPKTPKLAKEELEKWQSFNGKFVPAAYRAFAYSFGSFKTSHLDQEELQKIVQESKNKPERIEIPQFEDLPVFIKYGAERIRTLLDNYKTYPTNIKEDTLVFLCHVRNDVSLNPNIQLNAKWLALDCSKNTNFYRIQQTDNEQQKLSPSRFEKIWFGTILTHFHTAILKTIGDHSNLNQAQKLKVLTDYYTLISETLIKIDGEMGGKAFSYICKEIDCDEQDEIARKFVLSQNTHQLMKNIEQHNAKWLNYVDVESILQRKKDDRVRREALREVARLNTVYAELMRPFMPSVAKAGYGVPLQNEVFVGPSINNENNMNRSYLRLLNYSRRNLRIGLRLSHDELGASINYGESLVYLQHALSLTISRNISRQELNRHYSDTLEQSSQSLLQDLGIK